MPPSGRRMTPTGTTPSCTSTSIRRTPARSSSGAEAKQSGSTSRRPTATGTDPNVRVAPAMDSLSGRITIVDRKGGDRPTNERGVNRAHLESDGQVWVELRRPAKTDTTVKVWLPLPGSSQRYRLVNNPTLEEGETIEDVGNFRIVTVTIPECEVTTLTSDSSEADVAKYFACLTVTLPVEIVAQEQSSYRDYTVTVTGYKIEGDPKIAWGVWDGYTDNTAAFYVPRR